MHKSYVLGFFEIALQKVISSTLSQIIPVGSTEQPLHLPLVMNQKNVICRNVSVMPLALLPLHGENRLGVILWHVASTDTLTERCYIDYD
jgi:hypothetical protein